MMNIERFEAYLDEGRLIRGKWTSQDVRGRATACWLAALFDEVAAHGSASACPADQLPPWLASLIPWMDDSGTLGRWRGFAQRLIAALKISRTEVQWYRAEYAVRAICVREAMRHTAYEPSVEVCKRVADLADAVAAGGLRDGAAWSEAASAASALASSSASTAWRAAWSEAAATAAASAAWSEAAAASAAAVPASALAAAAAASDKIIDGILSVLEGHAA